MKPGDLITRKHARPQNRRHGFVVAVKGKLVTVKLTGATVPIQLHKDQLEVKQ